MSTIDLRLRYEIDRLYLTGTRLEFADLETLDAVIRGLTQTRNYMAARGMTQEEIYHASLHDMQNQAISDARIEYPLTNPFAIRRKDAPNRTRRSPIYNGVYVVSTEERPDWCKIGQSTDLYKRARQIKYDPSCPVEDPTITPVAFVHTQQSTAIETFLHHKFSEFHIAGEWYQRAPVEEWFEQFRSAA